MIRVRYYAKWGLKHWTYYIENREVLNDQERDEATVFFRVLKTLPPDDIAFLARKYKTGVRAYPNTRGTTDKQVTDKELAKREGIELSALAARRQGIERKMNKQIIDERELLEARKANRLGRYKLKLDRQYLVSIELKSLGYISVLLTDDPSKATIFTGAENEMHWGIFFRKVPVGE